MDEGIKEKFFSDLSRFYHQKPEVDALIHGFENVGLKSYQSDTASDNVQDPRPDGDHSTGNRNMHHPIRIGAEDCSFFVRTGTCKFGRTCKFNHPVSNIAHVDQGKSNENGAESSSKSLSRIPCKFYQTGFCKYGDSCRFSHSIFPQHNVLGLPKRWGQRFCSFYMRTGVCGYGTSCRFHHPQPFFFFLESNQEQEQEEQEINGQDFSEKSTTSHVRTLQFGSLPYGFDVYQKKNGHSLIDGSTSESPSGGKTK
ncbi:hypothetical protein LXL04_006078 [Taraxacum kok-saghyz]